MQLSAVLPVSDSSDAVSTFPYHTNSSTGESLATLSMPEPWVRGAILVRINSLLRGHSAVRLEIIRFLVKLLQHDIVPLVPLRGSISASGDLCPLSYIAGTLEGNPDVYVWSGLPNARVIISAEEALKAIGVAPVDFGPKETLGLLNGTAFSVSVATLCHHEASNLLVLSQILTAMGVEALLGTAESFSPFIANVRPHPGQVEAATNIRVFLSGSKLASNGHSNQEEQLDGMLKQDRYALRTSSQWLSPVIEDMALARLQLEIELNSTTDNPLVDAPSREIYHGGNFQGSSITSSTEKTRLGLEKIGKLIFAQSTELLNARLAYNLPPNLAADEPSLSYTMKGIDINMAAYYSELAYVANPVSNHVQSAEMSNQAINSLALISARATYTAVDLVSLLASAYLYVLCQALDLRAMDKRFMAVLEPEVVALENGILSSRLPAAELATLHKHLWAELKKSLAATTGKDSSERFTVVAISVQHLVVKALQATPNRNTYTNDLDAIGQWTKKFAVKCKMVFLKNRADYLACPDAIEHLGMASKKMYSFVRSSLAVPMHKGLIDHPGFEGGDSGKGVDKRVTTGTQISKIYKALREERMTGVVMECLAEAIEIEKREGRASKL